MTDFRIILRSLTSRRFSTITTILSVAIAVALVLALLSLRRAGEAAFARGSGNVHLVVSADASPLTAVLNGVFHANAPRAPITWAKYEEIADLLPWEWTVPTQLGDSYRGLPVVATTSEFFVRFEPVVGEPWRFAEGRRFVETYEIAVGAEAARLTGLSVGDRIALTHGFGGGDHAGHSHDEHLFEVVGILEPSGSAHDRALFTDLTSSWLMHAEDRLAHGGDGAHDDDHGHDHDHDHGHVHVEPEDLTDADRLITGILLRVPTRAGAGSSAILQQAFDTLRRDPMITVAQPATQIQRLFRIVGSIDRILIAMAIAVLISSGIGIMLALWNSMEQRRRQIAVLRVLGCSRPRIVSLVVTESALLGMVGAIAGASLSIAVATVAAQAMRERLGIVVSPTIDPFEVLVVLLGTIALAVCAGLAPALRAYGTPVLRSLRPTG